MVKEYEDRKKLSFEEAEGVAPIPSQLQPKEISQQLRALLWAIFHDSFENYKIRQDYNKPRMGDPWRSILYAKHVTRDHRMADEFTPNYASNLDSIKDIFLNGSYTELLGFVQWVLRRNEVPPNLSLHINRAFNAAKAAYVVLGVDTIVPVASEAEKDTIARAFADVASSEFRGARKHLHAAATSATEGNFSDSIRESIHAVESVARTLHPEANTLGPALAKLEQSIKLHKALRQGFGSLYGFTSDQEGIRHPLIDEPVAPVDQTDALYMLGSCASFVSYLINKARSGKLLDGV